MNKNIKIGMLISIVIILIIVVVIFIKIRVDIINEQRQDEKENQAMLDFANEMIPKYKRYEVIEIALKKNQNWSDFIEYFTDDFKKKYNEKDGILGKTDVEDAYRDTTYVPQEIDYWDTDTPVYIVKSNGKRYRYYFRIKSNEWRQIDDLEIIDIVDLDSEDEETVKGVKFTENTIERLLYNMIFAYDGEAGLSKHFREKYPNFNGFFDKGKLLSTYIRWNGEIINGFRIEHYGDIDYSNRVFPNINIIDGYRGIQYTYNLIYTLDTQGYLDDFEMQLIDKTETKLTSDFYKKNTTYESIIRKLSGKNRNWQGLPISHSFREKYNEKDGIFSDLEVDWVEFLCDTIGVKKYPICIHLQDGNIKYYGLIFKLTETNLIDDIEKIELNVDNDKSYTAGELLKMF